MIEPVDWYTAPTDPEARRRAYARNTANGHRMLPGASDHDMGLFFDGTDAIAPLYKPYVGTPERRTEAAPGRYKPMLAAVWLVVVFAAALGLAVR